jgi:hypothetical protein
MKPSAKHMLGVGTHRGIHADGDANVIMGKPLIRFVAKNLKHAPSKHDMCPAIPDCSVRLQGSLDIRRRKTVVYRPLDRPSEGSDPPEEVVHVETTMTAAPLACLDHFQDPVGFNGIVYLLELLIHL